jgi:adhesin/invasin
VESGAAGPSFSEVQLPVSVTIGGIPASVQYQGLAPGYVGLYQVNAVIPTGVTPGSAVPILMRQNGIPSNPNQTVTIPIVR